MSHTRISPHDKLIERMAKAEKPVDDKGMCNGYALTGLQALLVGDPEHLLARQQVIYDIPVDWFAPGELRKQIPDIEDGSFAAEVDCYFSTVAIHHNYDLARRQIYQHKGSPYGRYQNLYESFDLLSSIELQSQGGIFSIDNILQLFSTKTLANYFSNLKQLYINLEKPFSLALLIESDNHAISVGYDIGHDVWYILSANNDIDESRTNDIATAAKIIMTDFSANDTAVLVIKYFSCNNMRDNVKSIYQNWSKEVGTTIEITPDMVNGHDSNGTSLLYMAIRYDLIQLACQLLLLGANPIQSASGTSPLYVAANHGQTSIVKALLKLNATNINQPDPETGTTPLIQAARQGHEQVVHFLLLYGADTHIVDKNRQSALDLATSDTIKNMIKFAQTIKCKPLSKNKRKFFDVTNSLNTNINNDEVSHLVKKARSWKM
jgi:ankyrin repeat protein